MKEYATNEIKASRVLNGNRAKILRTFLILAEADKPLSAKRLAFLMDISYGSFMRVAQFLQENECVESVFGVHGGYRLSRPAKDITVLDILAPGIVQGDEPFALNELSERVTTLYDGITLADLAAWNQ